MILYNIGLPQYFRQGAKRKVVSVKVFDTEESVLAESFGRCVARHRKAAGLTQIQLCNLVGVAKPFLSRVENGRTLVNLRTMARIAKALDLKFHELCEGVDISYVNLENREYKKAHAMPTKDLAGHGHRVG